MAQVVGFALSPILSRIYGPEDFGVFALYLQVLAPISVLGGSAFFLILPKAKDLRVSRLVLHIVFACSVSIAIGVLLVGPFLDLRDFTKLWPCIALGLVITNLRGFFHFESLALKDFGANSKFKALESLLGGAGNIAFGLFGLKYLGLILGNILGQMIFIIGLFIEYKNYVKYWLDKQGGQAYKIFFGENKKHILVQSLNYFIEYALVFLFSWLIVKLTSVSELGYFAFCFKVVSTPLNLFSDYFSQSVLSRMSDFEDRVYQRAFLVKVSILVWAVVVLISLIFLLWGPHLFTFIFGEQWLRSGSIAKYYIVAIGSTFFIRSLQYVPNIVNRQEIYSLISFFTFGLPPAVLLISFYKNFELLFSLKILSFILLLLAFVYQCLLLFLFRKDKP